jgi:hypothetical protein
MRDDPRRSNETNRKRYDDGRWEGVLFDVSERG